MRGWTGAGCAQCARTAPKRPLLAARLALADDPGRHGTTWSGVPSGRLVPPENRIDEATLDNATRPVCAPVWEPAPDADMRYVLKEIPDAVLDVYLRGYFALAVSVPDAWLHARRARDGRAGLIYTLDAGERARRGPVLPGTLSRFDGRYYDCDCVAHRLRPAVVEHLPAPNATPVNTTAAVASAGTPLGVGLHEEWVGDAQQRLLQCVSIRDVAEHYAHELAEQSRRVARMAARAEVDSPRQSVSAGMIVAIVFLVVVGAGAVVGTYAAGVWELNHAHPAVVQGGVVAGRVFRAGLVVRSFITNQDIRTSTSVFGP